jgi:hypothetical protein
MAETSQDLERFLLGFHQRRGIGAYAAQGVGPFGTRRALRVESKRRRVEKDALPLDLFDHGPFGEHVLERLAPRQPARFELQMTQLGQRMVLVKIVMISASVSSPAIFTKPAALTSGSSFRRWRKYSDSNSPREYELATHGGPHRQTRAAASAANCS